MGLGIVNVSSPGVTQAFEPGNGIKFTSKEGNPDITVISAEGVSSLELKGIRIKTAPTKTSYYAGESFNNAGLVVEASYGYGLAEEVTGYTISPSGALSAGTTKVTITYSEGGKTFSAEQAITVTKRSVAIPTVKTNPTYNGSSQSPAYNNYDASKMTISGNTSGTNAGSYEVTFTLNNTDLNQWSDGTTAAKKVSWTMNKKAGSLTLSASAVTLDTSNLTKTVTATREGTGAITASSNNTSIATVSVSGTTITISHVNKASGTATITVNVAADGNHTAPASKTITVTAAFVSTTLNSNSWATIKDVSDAGTGANYWSVGDQKSIVINGTIGTLSASNISINVFILGFNHNSSKEGTKRIHFQIGKINNKLTGLCTSTIHNWGASASDFTMNGNSSSNSTNAGGWNNCKMRKTTLGNSNSPTSPLANSFMAALPADLRAVMKSVTKYTDNTGNSSNVAGNVTATTDYLWLLAEFEIFGTRSYANRYEQNSQLQYDYYKAGNSKIFYNHSNASQAVTCWERSPYYANGTYFCFVNNNGNAGYDSSGGSYAVAPCFAV